MEILLQLIYSGIALGMIYAVIAFGYQLTFATSDTLNFGRKQGWKQVIFGHIGRNERFPRSALQSAPPVDRWQGLGLIRSVFAGRVVWWVLQHPPGRPVLFQAWRL